ncbi:hypothetical protein LCGC14_3132880 [marine sediment metagenome]|uniref:Uncharacterized protein n=1 Tax=marine sediment metagenome TaxID=412755 RepID=A0A0F8VZ58_9ZZZZ
MLNLRKGHFPVTHPPLRLRYDAVRAEWLRSLFWTSQHIREQIRNGPDHSNLGTNLARDAALLANLEGELRAIIDTDIALRAT